jgi:hypothetical protein
MADPTAVNSQITDAVTQSNVEVVPESPALAIGTLYQTLAQSTGILIQNAVAAQQQQNALAQAAAAQGVMQIYSLETAATAAAATTAIASAKTAPTSVGDRITTLLKLLEVFNQGLYPSPKGTDAPQTADVDVDVDAASTTDAVERGIVDRPPAAMRAPDDAAAGDVSAVVDHVRSCVDAMAHATDAMNRVTHDKMVHVLLEAALAATLSAMIREPEKSAEYETVLQAIKRMG